MSNEKFGCPICGEEVTKEMSRCPKCGIGLSWQAPPAQEGQQEKEEAPEASSAHDEVYRARMRAADAKAEELLTDEERTAREAAYEEWDLNGVSSNDAAKAKEAENALLEELAAQRAEREAQEAALAKKMAQQRAELEAEREAFRSELEQFASSKDAVRDLERRAAALEQAAYDGIAPEDAPGKKQGWWARRKAAKAAERAEEEEYEKALENGSRCSNCGEETSPGTRFCPSCGAPIQTEQGFEGRSRRSSKLKRDMGRLVGEEAASTTNDLTGFSAMFENGIAETVEGVFSQTIEFGDISYVYERDKTKDDIFEKFAQLHASFPPESCYQVNLMNFPLPPEAASDFLEEEGPTADMAAASNELLRTWQRKSRATFEHRNFFTYAVEAPDEATAFRQLASFEETVVNHFTRRMKVSAEPLTGVARARVIHDFLCGREGFYLDYDRLKRTKREHVRDFCAPAWAAYPASQAKHRAYMALPGRYVKTYHIKDFGADLSDEAIRTLRALPIPMNISLLFRPIAKKEALKKINRNIAATQAQMTRYSAEQLKAGGDAMLLPPALEEKEAGGRELRQFVRDEDQHIAYFQGMITICASTEEELESHQAMLFANNVWDLELIELPQMQEQALMGALPLATPHLPDHYRSLSNAESAAMIPFVSQSFAGDPARSYTIGTISATGEVLRPNPDEGKSGHMSVLGITGGGKGMEMKSILNWLFLRHPRTVFNNETGIWMAQDPYAPQLFVMDYHAEYPDFARRHMANVTYFGPNHESCINLLNLSGAEGELAVSDVVDNIDFFLALFSSLLGRPLMNRESSLLDRCLNDVFAPHIGQFTRPTLADLHAKLLELSTETLPNGEETASAICAEELAASLEIFTVGSMASFAGQTNVHDDPYMNIYVLSDVGHMMNVIVTLAILQHVKQVSFANHAAGRPTYLLIEEFQKTFDYDPIIKLVVDYAAEMRKYGLHLILVTQRPENMLKHPEAVKIFDNCGITILLPQRETNVATLADIFQLSESQTECIGESAPAGTGLAIIDGAKIPFNNVIPRDNLLYEVFNTDGDKFRNKKADDEEDAA